MERRSEERPVGKVTGVQTCALPISMAVRRELACASGLHPSFRISRTGCAIRPHSRRPLSWNGVSQEETGILQRQTSDRRAAQWKITPLLGSLVVRKGFRDSYGLDGLDIPQGCLRSLSGNAVFLPFSARTPAQ